MLICVQEEHLLMLLWHSQQFIYVHCRTTFKFFSKLVRNSVLSEFVRPSQHCHHFCNFVVVSLYNCKKFNIPNFYGNMIHVQTTSTSRVITVMLCYYIAFPQLGQNFPLPLAPQLEQNLPPPPPPPPPPLLLLLLLPPLEIRFSAKMLVTT